MNTRRRRRRQQQVQVTVILTVIALILFSIIFLQLSKSTVIGSKDFDVSYISVEVSEDDTLWALANEFGDQDFYEVDEYIEKIMDINGLRSETIYPGQRLTMPVYTENVSM